MIVTLRAGGLVAEVLPNLGMLVTSLRTAGVEWLRLVDQFEDAVENERSIGIPLLHPWANRLSAARIVHEGQVSRIDPNSPLIMRDWNGTIIHGVHWSRLPFTVVAVDDRSIEGTLDWTDPALLEVFAFPHRLTMRMTVAPDRLEIRVRVDSIGEATVPIAFGFHPCVGLPHGPRHAWVLDTPPMRRRRLDAQLLPSGGDDPFDMHAPLASEFFDDGFDLPAGPKTFALSMGSHALHFDFIEGFPYLQIYAPVEQDYICIEPMTAPTDALVTGEAVPFARPGKPFFAEFHIRVEPAS